MARVYLAILLPAFFASSALAQSALPGAADPAQIERQFEAPEQPRAGGQGIATPHQQGTEAPEGAEAAMFVLRGLEIEGGTVYAAEALRSYYEPYLNTQVSVKTLYDIAAAVTARYFADGYVLSQAVVPPQRINGDGIARLRVVEGYVDQVLIQGEVEGPESLLRAYGERIRAERPLRLATLERYLLLASDLPGVTASGALMPSETAPGAADLVFQVRHKSVDAVASLDNRGSRYVGPWQSVVGGNLNSALGLYERTSLLYAATPFEAEELKYGRVTHEQPLDAEGTRLSLEVGVVASHPGYILKEAAVRSRSLSMGVGVSHPFIRSRTENLTLRGRVDARNALTAQNVDETVAKDAIRVLRLGGSYDWVDTWGAQPGVTLLSAEISQGLDILGARRTGSDGLSVRDGRSDFFKGTVEVTRTQRLVDDFSLLIGVTGQWAGSTLLSAEQFTVGGGQYGRGYDPAEIAGDHGVAGKLELRYAGPEIAGIDNWQLYGFWDAGRTWRVNPGQGAGRRDLASTGVGARSNLNDQVALTAELAKPLTHRASGSGEDNGKDIRGYLGLVVRY